MSHSLQPRLTSFGPEWLLFHYCKLVLKPSILVSKFVFSISLMLLTEVTSLLGKVAHSEGSSVVQKRAGIYFTSHSGGSGWQGLLCIVRKVSYCHFGFVSYWKCFASFREKLSWWLPDAPRSRCFPLIIYLCVDNWFHFSFLLFISF